MDSSFLKALAQARPDPGGGAAAAHSAALGLALLEKVARLERRRGPGANPEFPWDDLLARVNVVAGALLRLQAEDVDAYFQLSRARTQGDPGELSAALEEAVACPLRIMQQVQEGFCLIYQGGARCKFHLVSDLLVACELLGAAFRAAHHIARANLPLLPADARRTVWDTDLTHTLDAVESEFQQVRAALMKRDPCP